MGLQTADLVELSSFATLRSRVHLRAGDVASETDCI